MPEWPDLDDPALEDLDTRLSDQLQRFPTAGSANESQTEDGLIWPVLNSHPTKPK